MVWARIASIVSPARSRRRAGPSPTSLGSVNVEPPSGTSPMRAKAEVKLAPAPATRKSQASTRSRPNPATVPATIAMTGTGQRTMATIAAWKSLRPCCSSATLGLGPSDRSQWRSSPTQKCPPAPPSTTVSARADSSMASMVSASSRASAGVSALRRAGRFSVSRWTGPSTEYKSSSDMAQRPPSATAIPMAWNPLST